MTENISGREAGEVNLQLFNKCIADHNAANDWKAYIHKGKLNKSEIAKECGFGRSVFSQNDGVIAAMVELESKLKAAGIITLSAAKTETEQDKDNQSFIRQNAIAKGSLDKRVKTLEEQNATLRAEVSELRKKLVHYQHIDDHICKTGRFPPP